MNGFFAGVPSLNETFSLYLIQGVIILGLCRSTSLIGFAFKQPRVVFEKIGGILLGPSLFPTLSLKYIQVIAGLGITIYMLVVGLKLDLNLIKSTNRKTICFVAFFSISVPFGFGLLISNLLYSTLQSDSGEDFNDKFRSFHLFLATAMSITAFPMLLRVLNDTGLASTNIGVVTMGASVLNDAAAWILLVIAVCVGNSGDFVTGMYMMGVIIAFSLSMCLIFKPLFSRAVVFIENKYKSDLIDNTLFSIVLSFTMLCSWCCSMMGLSGIFGAFLFGLVVPRGSRVHAACLYNVEEFITTHILPVYFALSGLRTDFRSLRLQQDIPLIVLACFLAIAGKLLGAGIPAYLCGFTPRQSAVIAVLMNTRGLLELIVLNAGLVSGILNTRVYSIMVIMCIFTTIIAMPIVQWIYPEHFRDCSDNVSELGDIELTVLEPSPVREGVGTEMKESFWPGLISAHIEDDSQQGDERKSSELKQEEDEEAGQEIQWD